MERPAEGNWKGLAAGIARATSDLLLPVCCAVCERLMPPQEAGIVCGHCWSRVRELSHPQCERCGHPVGWHTCRWCDLLPPFVRAARSYCWMGTGTGEKIVHALKYDGWRRIAHAMAERMARVSWVTDVVEERSAIVPVPLSRTRQRERGYNQSAEIALALAHFWNVPMQEDFLLRTASTTSQTQLTPGERKSNVAGAFAVPDSARARLRGAHVVMVDDVITTGSTLNACASALFAAGARTISYMTFGRAPASGDRLHPQDRTPWL